MAMNHLIIRVWEGEYYDVPEFAVIDLSSSYIELLKIRAQRAKDARAADPEFFLTRYGDWTPAFYKGLYSGEMQNGEIIAEEEWGDVEGGHYAIVDQIKDQDKLERMEVRVRYKHANVYWDGDIVWECNLKGVDYSFRSAIFMMRDLESLHEEENTDG
jgi:hypothetical protein